MAIHQTHAACRKQINAPSAEALKQAVFDHIVMCVDDRCMAHYRAWIREGIPEQGR